MLFWKSKDDELINAVKKEDINLVNVLLKEFNQKISNGKLVTALEIASKKNNLEIVEILFSECLTNKRKNNIVIDNIFIASITNHDINSLKLYITKGKDLISNRGFQNALNQSIKNNEHEGFKILLDMALEKFSIERLGNVLVELSYSNKPKLMNILLQNTGNKITSEYLGEALIGAASKPEIANKLIDFGKNLISSRAYGITLHNAASFGCEDVVLSILNKANEKITYKQIKDSYITAANLVGEGSVTPNMLNILKEAMESKRKEIPLDNKKEAQIVRSKILGKNNKTKPQLSNKMVHLGSDIYIGMN